MSSKSKIPIVEAGSDDEADQVIVKEVKKPKRERTPAQQEAFKKALSVLKEKRETVKKVETEKYQKASEEEKAQLEKEKYEKAKNHKKKLPPAPSYVTISDLEKFKLDILGAIPKPEKKEPEPKKVEPVVSKPVVIERPVEKTITKPLTGHDLLDKLFFS